MGCKKHLIGLDGGSNEKTGEGYHGKTEPASKVLIRKSLYS